MLVCPLCLLLDNFLDDYFPYNYCTVYLQCFSTITIVQFLVPQCKKNIVSSKFQDSNRCVKTKLSIQRSADTTSWDCRPDWMRHTQQANKHVGDDKTSWKTSRRLPSWLKLNTRWQEKMTRAPKYYGCRNTCEDISQSPPLYCRHHCYIIITVITIDTTSSPLHGPTVDGHQSATPPWSSSSSSTSSTSSPLSPPWSSSLLSTSLGKSRPMARKA